MWNTEGTEDTRRATEKLVLLVVLVHVHEKEHEHEHEYSCVDGMTTRHCARAVNPAQEANLMNVPQSGAAV